MILVDMNQISVANVMMHLHMTKKTKPDIAMVRHMILNSLRMYRSKFHEKYGEVILCYDSKHYWRRDFFPQYKLNRKKGREKDNLDWNNIFEVLNKIKAEFKDNLPYKFLEVYGAEADDIIGALCKKYPTEKIMIISGDKDFIQLQQYDNVSQYSPITKKHINGQNPDTYIKEHILKGDSSDGIPNVLSPDHTFTDGIRQRPLSKKKIEAWSKSETGMNNEVKRNFQRNQKLIDLNNTPEELRTKILEDFNDAPCGDRSKLLNYFIHNRLKELTESIGDF